MKLFFSLLLSVAIMQGYAQQPFQGSILYKVATPNDDTALLNLQFGKNAIKIHYNRRGWGKMEQVLVNLDSGKVYVLDLEMKTFSVKQLFEKIKTTEAVAGSTIAGYGVTSTDLSEKGIAALVASMNRGQVLIYPANDLYYPVPPQYVSNIALSMVYDSRIILGLSLIDRNSREDGKLDTISIMAESVIPATLPDSIFRIPSNFFPEEQVLAAPPEPVYIESAIDTVTAPDPIVPHPPAAPPPAQPEEKKKKKSGVMKSSMRKPKK